MIYVMSDIHGEYEKYRMMLEKINFTSQDELYVLGDVVDRGAEPVKILQDMAIRENVFLLKGNHEIMASFVLKRLNVEITSENAETQIDFLTMRVILEWQQNGGETTMKEFRTLSKAEKLDILDYLDDTALFEVVEVNEKAFILVHAGLGNFSSQKALSEYTVDEITNSRPDYRRKYFSNPSIYIVSGHTPTRAITGKDEIFHSQNNILIDCAASFGGRLACLCLDSMEEFYV